MKTTSGANTQQRLVQCLSSCVAAEGVAGEKRRIATFVSAEQQPSRLNGSTAIGSLVAVRCLVQQTFDPEMYVGSVTITNEADDEHIVSQLPMKYRDKAPDLPRGHVEVSDSHASPRSFAASLKERQRVYAINPPGNRSAGSNNTADNSHDHHRGYELVFYDTTGKHHGQRLELSDFWGQALRVNDCVDLIGIFEGLEGHESAADDKAAEMTIEKDTDSERQNADLSSADATWATSLESTNGLASCGPRAKIQILFHSVLGSIYDEGLDKFLPLDAQYNRVGHKLPSPTTAEPSLKVAEECVQFLSHHATGGDRLAAEYIVMAAQIASTRKVGTPELSPCLTLNILTAAGKEAPPSEVVNAGRKLATRIESAVGGMGGCVVRLSMSIDQLERGRFAPKWDESRGRLHKGSLQLAAGCLGLIDETQLRTGKLSEVGLRSVASLKQICGPRQEMLCNFGQYEVPLRTNCCFMVISETNSIIRDPSTFLSLNWTPTDRQGEGDIAAKDDHAANRLADAWKATVTRLPTKKAPSVGKELTEKITEEFVGMRQKFRVDRPEGKENEDKGGNHIWLTPELLRQWLMMATARAAMNEEEEVSEERWREVMALEEARRKRFKQTT